MEMTGGGWRRERRVRRRDSFGGKLFVVLSATAVVGAAMAMAHFVFADEPKHREALSQRPGSCDARLDLRALDLDMRERSKAYHDVGWWEFRKGCERARAVRMPTRAQSGRQDRSAGSWRI